MKRLLRICGLLAAAATASAATDAAAVLERLLLKLRESLKVIPNYTCVETITRDFYMPVAPLKRACDVMVEMKKHPTLDMTLRHTATDRLRLDVALTKRGEILAWVGESRFEDRPIDELIREGPAGTGIFAALLTSIFDQDVQSFQFEGESVVNGQARLQYSFDVPQGQSHYRVKAGDGWVTSGYHGSFDVDPAREELTALRMETAIFPPEVFTCRTSTEVKFTMTAIGAGVFPMASQAVQRFVAADGSEASNQTQFSQCREYRGESTITFGDAPGDGTAPAKVDGTAPAKVDGTATAKVDGTATAKAAGPKPEPIPAGVSMAMELTAPIDSATAAAGDRFTARLAKPLRAGRSTLAPAGSRVEGRIVRVTTTYRPSTSAVFVLRPEVVEARGVRRPLAATRDLSREIAAARKKRVEILLPFLHEAQSGLWMVKGERPVLPKGTHSEWTTVLR